MNESGSAAVFSRSDVAFMAEAVRLAKKGLYTTEPNPRVGCVIVRDGKIVGRGFHQRAGDAHAEINALAAAGTLSKGSTVYVTLEPCSHFGKTPPCADALIAANVAEVVAAMQDPNPAVSGAGFRKLEAAGISCRVGLLSAEAGQLNPGFIKRMEVGRPFVRVKMASSIDGRTAMASGESKWITGEAARADVQRLRARSSAVVLGIESVIRDDPSMTVRESELAPEITEQAVTRQPLRVILDSRGRLSPEAKVLHAPGPVLVVVTAGHKLSKSIAKLPAVEVLTLATETGRQSLDLESLLDVLGSKGCNEVLVESGAILAGKFIDLELWDELWLYMAPKLMGREARPLFDLSRSRMQDAMPLILNDLRMIGDDVRLIYGRQVNR
jgi:diaminohydroxyphosphoribosylaminopyrimidine deaminase/5-amino-6-(5-phosphoribosylamino)uracil reductase